MAINMQSYFLKKSVKLSDSFVVYANGKELVSCCGFTLPKLEYTEETIKYGNVTQSFLIPKYDNLQQVTIDVIESTKGDVRKKLFTSVEPKKWPESFWVGGDGNTYVAQKFRANGYIENDVMYTGTDANGDKIGYQNTFDTLAIEILSNKLTDRVLTYYFTGLKLVNMSKYELNYSSEDTCKWSLTFIFESYSKHYGSEKK